MKLNQMMRKLALPLGMTAAIGNSLASSDYGPAIWRPAYSGHWYTSGNGHKFCVCHDMEGYYLSSISYMQKSTTTGSVHYCVNGLTDSSDKGAAPGEVSQMVSESYYAWHALCWNLYAFGTEHEGFISNPAWFTESMYQATADLQAHLCNTWSIAKDRNHIVGHGEKSNANWCTYAEAHFGIDAHCNSHTDPGPYWDWSHLMDLINPAPPVPAGTPLRFKMDVNGDGKTDVVLVWNNSGTATIRTCLSTGSGFGGSSDSATTASFGVPGVDRQWIPMDVNGDGKTDLVLLWNNNGSTIARVYLSTGSGFTNQGDSTIAGSFGTLGVNRLWMKGDVNGDGKEDLILIWNDNGGSTARVCLSTGTGFGITSDSTVAGSFGTLNVDRQWIPMDVNHDGKTDLVLIWKDTSGTMARVCLNSGTNTFGITSDSNIAGSWDTLNTNRLILKGDVNGDGKEDLILMWKDSSGQSIARTCLSSGTAFSFTADSGALGSWGTLNVDRQWIPMDVNGDGKTDLVLIWNNSGVTSARTCLASANTFNIISDSTVAGGWDTMNVNRLYSKGDISGDGKEDLIVIWNSGGSSMARACLSTGSAFGITSDNTVAGSWGTLGVDRLFFPPGM